MVWAKLEKIKQADPKTYEKITDVIKWATLIIVAGIVIICVICFVR